MCRQDVKNPQDGANEDTAAQSSIATYLLPRPKAGLPAIRKHESQVQHLHDGFLHKADLQIKHGRSLSWYLRLDTDTKALTSLSHQASPSAQLRAAQEKGAWLGTAHWAQPHTQKHTGQKGTTHTASAAQVAAAQSDPFPGAVAEIHQRNEASISNGCKGISPQYSH